MVSQRDLSYNDTNFVGAYHQLGDALNEHWGNCKLRAYLQQAAIQWSFNPSAESHIGGVWERLIRSVRRAFNAITRNVTLDDYELQTLMCEIEAVVNPVVALSRTYLRTRTTMSH